MVTSEEWKKIEENLKSFYSSVKLKCDAYEVTIMLQRISPMKNALVVYVNGHIKGEWLTNDCEERRRFLRPVTKSCLSAKDKKRLKKHGKKFLREMEEKSKYTYYDPYWTSFRALKKHLIDHSDSIELNHEGSIMEEI